MTKRRRRRSGERNEEFFSERTAGSGAPGKPRARDVGGGNHATTRSSRIAKESVSDKGGGVRASRGLIHSTEKTTKNASTRRMKNVRLGFGIVVVVASSSSSSSRRRRSSSASSRGFTRGNPSNHSIRRGRRRWGLFSSLCKKRASREC